MTVPRLCGPPGPRTRGVSVLRAGAAPPEPAAEDVGIRSARAPLGVRFQSINLFIAAWRYGTRLQKLGAFRYTEQWLFLLTECHLIS